MSLEERMASLEAAIKELTAVVSGKANSGGGAAKDEAPKEDGRRRRREKDDDKKDDKKADDKKAPNVGDLRKLYGDWLGGEDDKGFDDRREFLEAVLDELGIDMLKNIKEADVPAAAYWLKQYKAADGGKVDFDDRGDGGSRRSARERV